MGVSQQMATWTWSGTALLCLRTLPPMQPAALPLPRTVKQALYSPAALVVKANMLCKRKHAAGNA